ncbi:MAG TPA: hypothetical protein VL588_07980 [Bdellovibrionota bacterium]|nr:hypothetical protein [Bdellovibrionota bacterium]
MRASALTITGALSLLLLADGRARAEEIQATHYQAVGTRWALQLDERSGQKVALHDLSYPNVAARVKLAKLDTRKEAVENARASLDESEDSAGVTWAKRALKQVEKHGKDWWKKIPWTPEARARMAAQGRAADTAPEVFRLSDILLTDERGDELKLIDFVPDEYKDQVRQSTPEDREYLGLDSFELRADHPPTRGETPAYDMYWSPRVEERGSHKAGMTPRKIVDFEKPGRLLAKALVIDAIRTALGQLIGKIPIPVVSALISTTVGQFFGYRSDLIRIHGAMALEMLRLSETGESHSPFDFLTAAEREKAVLCLAYDQATLSDLATWIVSPPVKSWHKDIVSTLGTVDVNRGRLQLKGWTPTLINGVVADAENAKGERRIYLMDKSKLLGLPPLSINFSHPDARHDERIAIASGSVLVSFGGSFIPVPFVGFLLGQAYSYFLENPWRDAQRREAHFQAWLEESDGTQPDQPEEILRILYKQRVNPFALDRIKTYQLIELRKQYLGIGLS